MQQNAPNVFLDRGASHQVVRTEASTFKGPCDQWLRIPTLYVPTSRSELESSLPTLRNTDFEQLLADTLNCTLHDTQLQHAAVLTAVQQEFGDQPRREPHQPGEDHVRDASTRTTSMTTSTPTRSTPRRTSSIVVRIVSSLTLSVYCVGRCASLSCVLKLFASLCPQ